MPRKWITLLQKKLTGANSIDVKKICSELNIPYTPQAENHASELSNSARRLEQCKTCTKQGKEAINCYCSKVTFENGSYYFSSGNCPRAKNYLIQERINRLTNISGISNKFKACTFSNFKPTVQTQIAYTKCIEFVKNYKDNIRGLRLAGTCGCGKTHLASAILNNLISKNIPCMYVVVPELLDSLRIGFNDKEVLKRATEKIELAKKVNVLMLDDLGAEHSTDWAKEQLYLLINARYENDLTTIITTNLLSQELFKQLGNRIMSRIVEMTTAVTIKGASDYRLNNLG